MNLTVNLTNYPTNFQCVVQNVTNTGSVTKSTNLPVATTELAMATVMTNNDAAIKNYAIRYLYFESV